MHRESSSNIQVQDASALRIGIVVSSFNADLTESMLQGALKTLKEWKVKERNIEVLHMPGSFELPYGCARLLAKKRKPDAVIAIGCIIKGATDHDKYLAASVTDGLMRLSLDHLVPIASGITTANTLAQAKERANGELNRGKEAALAALQTALI